MKKKVKKTKKAKKLSTGTYKGRIISAKLTRKKNLLLTVYVFSK